MGCEYKLVCYDCKVSVVLGKMYLGLAEKDALKAWLFLLKHNGHRLGLLGSEGKFQDFYLYGFPEDEEILKEVGEEAEGDISNWYVYWKASDIRRIRDRLLVIENLENGRQFVLTFNELKGVKSVESLKGLMKKFFAEEEFKNIGDESWRKLWLIIRKRVENLEKIEGEGD